MVFITGDTHGSFTKIFNFVKMRKDIYDFKSEKDFLIVLGDAGINYFLNGRDRKLKKKLTKLPLTLICIHGNHEERPQNIDSYKLIGIKRNNIEGKFYCEPEFPNILFPTIGGFFQIENQEYWHLGGAWSYDKLYRLAQQKAGLKNFKWYESEQMTTIEKMYCLMKLDEISNKNITVLSHTCPLKYIPVEKFLNHGVKTIDHSMEKFLDTIEDKLEYKNWYCGHWHTDKIIDKIRFVYEDIIESR
jgi:3-oxoacid CoA-transferase subunit A